MDLGIFTSPFMVCILILLLILISFYLLSRKKRQRFEGVIYSADGLEDPEILIKRVPILTDFRPPYCPKGFKVFDNELKNIDVSDDKNFPEDRTVTVKSSKPFYLTVPLTETGWVWRPTSSYIGEREGGTSSS